MSNSDFYVNLDATPHALILHLDALLPTLFKEMADWTDKAMLEDMKPANPHGVSEEEMNQRQGAWNYDLATPVIIKLNDSAMIPRSNEDITLKNPTKYDQDNDGKLKTVGLPAILTVGLKKYSPQVNFDLRSSAQRYVADCLEDNSLLVSDCQTLLGTQSLQEKLKIAYADERPPGMYVTRTGQQAQSSGPWLDVAAVSGFAHVSIAAIPPGGLGPTASTQSGTTSKAKVGVDGKLAGVHHELGNDALEVERHEARRALRQVGPPDRGDCARARRRPTSGLHGILALFQRLVDEDELFRFEDAAGLGRAERVLKDGAEGLVALSGDKLQLLESPAPSVQSISDLAASVLVADVRKEEKRGRLGRQVGLAHHDGAEKKKFLSRHHRFDVGTDPRRCTGPSQTELVAPVGHGPGAHPEEALPVRSRPRKIEGKRPHLLALGH